MVVRRASWGLWLIAVALASVACTPTAETTANPNVLLATEVYVAPDAFLFGVPCAAIPGAMQSYVATVTDVTAREAKLAYNELHPDHPKQINAEDTFVLPSSRPLPCSQVASFRYVQVGYRYTAEIDGYEEPASALVPVGPGDRHMVTGSAGLAVTPRWTTVSPCGMGTDINGEPNVAQFDVSMPIDDCSQLEDNSPGPVATAIVLDPRSTLGNLSCASSSGTVTTFDVTPKGSSLPPATQLDCATATPITYATGLTDYTNYQFTVDAYEGGPAPTYRATCFGTAKPGLATYATCDPLVAIASSP